MNGARGLARVLGGLVLAGLLLPALLLTVLRLTEPSAGSAVRLISFTPYALPFYVAALLGLLLAASRRPAGRRLATYAVAVVALVGVVLHGWWVAPAFVGPGASAAAGADRVVVMTSNLFEGRGDAEELVAAARDRDVDVLVLEEISMPLLADAETAGLREVFPYSIGGPAGYDPVAGTMVLSRTPLGEPTRVDTGHESWLVDVDLPGGAMSLLAVHPVAPTTPADWHRDHRVIAEAIGSARPDVVLGDFNATADHAPMQRLADDGYRDVGDLADVGWQPTWPANGLAGPAVPFGSIFPPLVRIDHVLVDGTFAGLGTETVDIAGTDHLALVASIARR